MYPWLADAIGRSACVLASSRRLARTLTEHYAGQQARRGQAAWRTPEIYYWRDWLGIALTDVSGPDPLPVRISGAQSRVVWERCLAQTIDDPLLNRGALLRQVQDTWSRLQDWQVTIGDCERSARSRDHFAYVRAARCYEAALEEGSWVDPAGLPELCARLVGQNRIVAPRQLYVAGFDRLTPQVSGLLDALRARGSDVEVLDPDTAPRLAAVYAYESSEAELRAAGRWARRWLDENGSARLAVIVPDLEQAAGRAGRLVQEGLVPGWQNGGSSLDRAANVSFGQPLLAYPAVRVASLLLRWLYSDIPTADVSMLLCSSLLGAGSVDGRCRLELELRQRPAQQWSPESVSAVLGRGSDAPEVEGWFRALRRLTRKRAALPKYASPAAWAAVFDGVLDDFGWPGAPNLSSEAFQLVNRWRELLNEFSRLTLVEGRLDKLEAHRRLDAMALETLFQPESTDPLVQVLGPLEAAGLEFDGIWVAGMTAANWPPQSRPLALVSRELQRERGMPDAAPEDTLHYGTRVLERLLGSGADVVVSHALHEGDAEQSLSGLVARYGIAASAGPDDPGWNAARLLGRVPIRPIARDRVPGVAAGERVLGGAATLQYQLTEPFSAFVRGRLGVRLLPTFGPGLTAQFRGSLVHDVLRYLYAELPDSVEIGTWRGDRLDEKAEAAVARTFAAFSPHADRLLKKLLQLEERRTAALARKVVALDRDRESFSTQAVESPVEAVIEGVRLLLRVDRIDRLPNGDLLIWDYKTGRSRKLLDRDGNPSDYQLVVYSCAMDGRIAGIGLYNIDSRAVGIDTAGIGTMSPPEWDEALARWQLRAREAARELAGGDVRINRGQSETAARALAILSRFRDLDDGL
jgi:probable DNA repair protein